MPTTVNPASYDAALFDLDGVLTSTRVLHMRAWRSAFETFLDQWDLAHGTVIARFDEGADYVAHVDGKPRQDGVRDFLGSRGITLPEGVPDSAPSTDSVWGLANLKQELVTAALVPGAIQAFPGSIAWVRELREAGVRTAVVSSSQNAGTVLDLVGIATLFDICVDGRTALDRNLPGKPAPDMFLEAARELGVRPDRAIVIEDALAGVEAGRNGGFALVVGVDRDGNAAELAEHGADVVVSDLGELLAEPTADRHRPGPRAHRLRAATRRILAASVDAPHDPWNLVETGFPEPDDAGRTESLFAVANGYLGIRGAHEEGVPTHSPGTLLNGFHETWPIVYPESAFGFANTGQTMVPVPDGTTIRLFVDEDLISNATTEVDDYERRLDMAHGTLNRTVTYQLPRGARIRVDTRRFVSLVQRHLACIRYELTVDQPLDLIVSSELVNPAERPAGEGGKHDPRRSRALADSALTEDGVQSEGARVIRTFRTTGSGLGVAAGMDHDYDPTVLSHLRTQVDEDRAHAVFSVRAVPGQTVVLTKWLGYHYGAEPSQELINRCTVTLARAMLAGFDKALAGHTRAVEEFWSVSDVEWDGAWAAQQALRFSIFSLLQGTSRSEGHGVGSKGQTGTGYEGHYFWDTEIYLLPFLIHTSPAVARSLLLQRIRALPAARRRARELACEGALFPWRTINGDEASPYYAAGTAQYHLNADIAYALNQYVQITGDTELLYRHGTELLVETARMWASLGFFSERHGGRFEILGVTGPDEYTAVVDNNLFTNLMAAENLQAAADAVQTLQAVDVAAYAELVTRCGIEREEVDTWRRAARLMHLPRDPESGLYLQNDHFLDLAPWDFANTPTESYPLLLHFHPLVIYRHQVIKQADVVLATVLLPDRFTPEQRSSIFDYYDAITTGDSSLSECIQAIAAADSGKYRTAEEYLVDALAVDLADTSGNVHDGLHLASAGGAWMAVVYGFAGYRWQSREFSPMLPTRARRLRFPLRLEGSVLEVCIEAAQVTYTIRSGGPITATHHGAPFTVTADQPVTFPGDYQTHDAPLRSETSLETGDSPEAEAELA